MKRIVERQSGFTLIELVISIVVIGVAIVSVAGALSATAIRSSETMRRQQAAGIANAYLAEVLSMPFSDPQPPNNEAGARALFDDVSDYDGHSDNGARNRADQAIVGLDGYNVVVDVLDVRLQPGDVPALRVTVTVQPPSGAPVVAAGFRTNHT